MLVLQSVLWLETTISSYKTLDFLSKQSVFIKKLDEFSIKTSVFGEKTDEFCAKTSVFG